MGGRIRCRAALPRCSLPGLAISDSRRFPLRPFLARSLWPVFVRTRNTAKNLPRMHHPFSASRAHADARLPSALPFSRAQ
ncbi:hypothetical protein BOC51_22365 [Burkholderia pseudomallei]|nr:hypothetical protein BOC51_22365 [Burkholderia pseudomallei]AYX39980.1 hypothetical protein EGY15_35340 [Burkholderia pseudomallei]PJO59991.1 hypothetical protein CWD85_07625 [Burkholderia pseudomallei]